MDFRDLFRYLIPHRIAFVGAALLMVGESIAALATPWLAGLYAKNLLLDSSMAENVLPDISIVGNSIREILILWLLVFVAQALFKFGSSYLVTISGAKILARLSNRLYQHVQVLPMGFFHSRKRGDLLALFSNDIAIISHFFTGTLISIVPMFFTMIGALLLMAMIDKYVALLIVLVIPGFFLIVKVLGRKIRAISETLVQKQANAMALTEENLSLMPIIKSFNRETVESRRYGQHTDDVLTLRKALLKLQSILSPVIQLLASMGILLVLWVSSQQLWAAQLTTPALVSLLLYGLLFARPVSSLANVYGQAQQAMGASKRLRAVFAVSPEPQAQSASVLASAKGEINFVDISFHHAERPPIFRQLRLLIKAGETVAITGENGMGKTTLLHLLMRFNDPQQGIIRIDGHDISGVSLSSLREQIGYVSQDTLLCDGTIADNIRYGHPNASQPDIEAVARSACVHDFVSRLPNGYQTAIGELGVRLSGGQRQRIALARVLLSKPQILLLDEATSMFDPQGELQFLEKARELFAQHTVILIAHSRASLALADRVLTLHNGQLTDVITDHEGQGELNTMTIYQIPEELLLQTVADETVILDPDSGNYFTLDSVGSRLIALFRENQSVQKTADKMAEEYQSTSDAIYTDLVTLLEEMAGHGLVNKT
jgi:ATP-binding cassette, subfamily B, bacterial